MKASSADILSGLSVRFPELHENTVAVVAIRPDGEIADFSNRCGIAADSCLAAPGEEIRVSYFGPGRDGNPIRSVADAGGTSFAAPMVTGGLALMKHYFRGQLSNVDLLARLLETADRNGPYADAEIYGRGLMDLGTATSPVGEPVVAMGGRVESPGAAIHDTSLQVGSAFGDAFVPSLASREIAAFDALGAPFWYDVGNLVTVSSQAFAVRAVSRLSAVIDPGGAGTSREHHPTPHPPVAGGGRRRGFRPASRQVRDTRRCEGQSLRACRTQPGRNLPGCSQPERHCAHHGRPCRAGSCVRCGAGVACA